MKKEIGIIMPAPIAYFLTWTCHGTWLHGDERGSVDREHNARGSPWIERNDPWRRHEETTLRHAPITLDDRARCIVHTTIVDHCRVRGWELHALNVRTNHVHVVLSCGEDVTPERVLSELKSWTTRQLRAANVFPDDVRPWTRHGSTRWIHDDSDVEAAIAYVMEGQ